jgi:hypothetical protein
LNRLQQIVVSGAGALQLNIVDVQFLIRAWLLLPGRGSKRGSKVFREHFPWLM